MKASGCKQRVVELHTKQGLCIVLGALKGKKRRCTGKIINLDFSPCKELCGWASVYCRQQWIIQESINYSEINRDSPWSVAPQVGWKKISRWSLSSWVKMASDQWDMSQSEAHIKFPSYKGFGWRNSLKYGSSHQWLGFKWFRMVPAWFWKSMIVLTFCCNSVWRRILFLI